MSIENQLAALTAAVIELTNALKGNAQSTVNVTPAPAPVAPQVMQQAPVAPQVQMPPPPVFAPQAPAPVFAAPAAPTGAPFSDGAGLIAYVMAAYKEMGPTKGAQIQGVLTQLGYQNINDVKPEHYSHLFQGVEALKRA